MIRTDDSLSPETTAMFGSLSIPQYNSNITAMFEVLII